MSHPQAPRLRALYRSLLRELPPRPILSSPRSPIHQRLRDGFFSSPPPPPPTSSSSSTTSSNASTPAPDSGAEASALAVGQAEQYLAYLRAQRTYVSLLERYNPGMGMEEEERVRLTARRVGMDLPVEYGLEPESGEGGSGSGKKE